MSQPVCQFEDRLTSALAAVPSESNTPPSKTQVTSTPASDLASSRNGHSHDGLATHSHDHGNGGHGHGDGTWTPDEHGHTHEHLEHAGESVWYKMRWCSLAIQLAEGEKVC